VLQEQQLLYPAENSRIQIELNQYLAFVQLYQALGGGFSTNLNTGTGSSKPGRNGSRERHKTTQQ
jgi:outer membrane protein TolC